MRRQLGIFCGLLILTGCAIKTAHLPIQQWPTAQRAAYFNHASPYRIAIVPFRDRRPANEQNGQKAQAMFLLLWNQRKGDYYTGNRVFGPNVPHQLSEQLALHLQAGNAFKTVRYLPDLPADFDYLNPEHVRKLRKLTDADYLLAGDLDHFFGSQHQQFSMIALPLYFFNSFSYQDNKGLPWGKTEGTFYLLDTKTGDIAWRHHMEATNTLPRATDSMAEAAMRSFGTMADKLATELRQLPMHPTQPGTVTEGL